MVPSKYKENLYQSLSGLNYLLDPVKKCLIRKSLDVPDDLRYDIKSQDTCFTREGQEFQRFMIDGILDDRCAFPGMVRKASLPATKAGHRTAQGYCD